VTARLPHRPIISARTSSANARKRGNGQPRKSDGASTPSSKGRSRSNDIPAPYIPKTVVSLLLKWACMPEPVLHEAGVTVEKFWHKSADS
jgi:hypothetical protein